MHMKNIKSTLLNIGQISYPHLNIKLKCKFQDDEKRRRIEKENKKLQESCKKIKQRLYPATSYQKIKNISRLSNSPLKESSTKDYINKENRVE